MSLSNIKYIIGTGGALTRLPNNIRVLKNAAGRGKGLELYPGKEAEILIDKFYIFASLGVLSKKYPEEAVLLMKKSIGYED